MSTLATELRTTRDRAVDQRAAVEAERWASDISNQFAEKIDPKRGGISIREQSMQAAQSEQSTVVLLNTNAIPITGALDQFKLLTQTEILAVARELEPDAVSMLDISVQMHSAKEYVRHSDLSSEVINHGVFPHVTVTANW